jgi:class 3 adenylate cyclase
MKHKRNLDHPDRRVTHGGIVQDIVEISGFTVGRTVHPPGWRWSKDLQPVVGGEWCMARHVGFVLSGRQTVEMTDGTTFELGPGDIYEIPPGHDGGVLGDEPLVTLDWSGIETWTRVVVGDRVLAGLLMTDVVGSTREALRLGDAAWRSRLAQHHESMRRQLDRYRGREMDTAGDSFFALFDGGARALECAAASLASADKDGISLRAAVHVGEVVVGNDGARGVAVHEVARMTALAEPGEILVSEATRLLVTGTAVTWEDRGEHELRGLEGPRRLFRYAGAP